MMTTVPNQKHDQTESPPVTASASVHQVAVEGSSVQGVAPTQTSPSTVQPSHCQASRQLVAGMMVVPSLSPQHVSPGLQSHPLFVQSVKMSKSRNELQILRAQAQQQQQQQSQLRKSPGILSPVTASGLATIATTVASASGGTIHHLGHSPLSRVGVKQTPLLANPIQQQLSLMSGNNQTPQQSPGQHQQVISGIAPLTSRPLTVSTSGSSTPTNQQRKSGVSRLSGQTSPSSDQSLLTLSTNTILHAQTTNRTSPLQSPERPRKRAKLEEISPANPEIATERKKICDEKLKEMARLKENYKEHLTELFFLQNGGNLMDYFTWKKRPTLQLLHFLKSGTLDSEDEDESQEKSINNEVKVLTTSGGTAPLATPVAIATSLPVSVATAHQDQTKRLGGRHGMVFGHVQPSHPTHAPQMPGGIPLSTTAATTTVGSPPPYTSSSSTPVSVMVSTVTTAATATVTTTTNVSMSSALAKMMMEGTPSTASNTSATTTTLGGSTRVATKQHSISAVYEHAIGSQEAIVERAKQEAQVMQRVAELRKEGLWSSRRLPKVQEPSRNKAHWDYLLEEMQWLAADFAQERKWKKAGARKIARMITRHFQELHQKEVKAEKEEGMKTKRIASNMAKMIKEFWSNIEKVVQYKQQSRLEEKRKKALDLHLSFIVDQTEKYSSWLTEGLSIAGVTSRAGSSIASGPDDGDFEPASESDDEETIEREEEEADGNQENTKDEVDALQKESELPLEDLLKTLPKEVLEKPASIEAEDDNSNTGKQSEDDFESGDEDSEDDEQTLAEQEKKEKVDHAQELKELEDEGDLTVEELYKKYAGAYDSDFEAELSQQNSDSEEETEEEEEEDWSEEEEEEVLESDEQEDIGIDFLAENVADSEPSTAQNAKQDIATPNKEITDIAEAAQSIQPTGYTLETTQVKTPIPFLLKHTLREYQHVGLDWLATLHERKLNGILADEMGLGKTIQTIAVLAHLATEWEVWGPHLIVVPTSVMLNWEMELKKWCPAFKILTYYGNQKERKLKRQGWTKTNAFHVCITSYKLVIQDHQSFRRKKWKYLILDEAQNIKNFKSQRWQTLLNFQSQRRLLLTGTPLQNSLMELWSLMHFLMPHVFQSHREFKEWFANPLSGMIEGSREYNETLIKRLHKVLRPFLLRRLKNDVEKQMPKKYEHVVMCRLSKRQRFLYDDFMSQTKTKETLASGHFMSVINILMQLRKVCNHPNLFDPRPVVSPFQMEGLTYHTPSLVIDALRRDPLHSIDLCEWNPSLAHTETTLSAFAAHRIRKLQTPRKLIEEIDSQPEPSPPCTQLVGRCKPFVFRSYSPSPQTSGRISPFVPIQAESPASTKVDVTQPSASVTSTASVTTSSTATSTGSEATSKQSSAVTTSTTVTQPQSLPSHPITLQIHQTQQGTRFMIPSGSLSQLPAGYIQIVQTSSGQQFIATTSQPLPQASSESTVVNGPSITVSTTTSTSTVSSVVKPVSTITLPTSSSEASNGKPVIKVSPMTVQNDTGLLSTVADLPCKPAVTPVVKPTPVIGTSLLASDRKKSGVRKPAEDHKSEFYLASLAEKRAKSRQEKLEKLANYNQNHCSHRPLYGQDLHRGVSVIDELPSAGSSNKCPWRRLGYVHCCRLMRCSNPNHPTVYWNQTDALRNLVHTPQQYMEELTEILDRFVFVIPPLMAPRIKMHSSHPPPSWLQRQRHSEFTLNKELAPKSVFLHKVVAKMTVQFPELRLIEYDCGKLQTLDLLLQKLKSASHRVLLFTQMTRMLDVLEQFLSYHGHRYLRLDGTTKVEQRQVLMDRFNMDKRIFCFILSTRSGGIGVNLTGADTVIFYDSDWNPTMDAQAQDRCHRIGQTRDVHIYRLISQRTVEENILKKANQKRLLGDVAIEGGNFTAAFFQQQTIKELFEEPSGLESLTKEKEEVPKPAPTPVQAPSARSKRSLERRAASPSVVADPDSKENITEDQLEQALCAAEEDTDIQAVKVVKAEQKAELAEFDENIPWDEREAELKKERDEEMSKVEQELLMLEKELTPVERYAVTYVEGQNQSFAEEELQKAEEEVTLAKEEWELSRLQALKEEDERRAELEEDEMLFTYSRDDAYSQVYINDETGEHMPMWAPPTPPQDDNDVYMDRSMCFLYEPSVMAESQLPPVYVKKEHKRIRIDPAIAAVSRKHKVRKEEQHHVPRSLFDRPQSLLRKERDLKLMKLKTFPKPLKPQLLQSRPMDVSESLPDWLIHEDWALLQALQMLQELPPTLSTDTPALIPNWDLVADMVNTCSRTYRSIKQCKNRYENIIVPREEGKILYDINPRKQKKSKGIYKTKNNRPMRTSQIYLQDNNSAITTLYTLRFDSCKAIAAKRTPTIRPTLANPTLKNPKHTAVLKENGIDYEQPLTPTQVATNRAERIAKEKQKSQEAAAAQQLSVQRASTTQTTSATGTVTVSQVTQAAAATVQTATALGQPQMTIVQGQPLQTAVTAAPTTVVVTAGSLQKAAAGSTVAAVSLPRTGSIVVNPASANAFAAINKRIAGQTMVGSVAQTLATTSTSTIAQAVRAARASGAQMTVQEIAAVVNQSPARVGTGTAQVITTTALTPAHIIAAQKGGTVISAGTVQPQTAGTTAKTLTPQQLQILRLKQQQIRRLTAVQAAQQQVSGAVTGQSVQKTVTGTTPLITSIPQSQITPTRLQLAKQQGLKGTTVSSRSLSEAEMAILLKQKQLQQQRAALSVASGATIVSQGSQGVQQVQVTQGHVARLTTAQIIAGTQVQQVQAGQSSTGTSQPVATLVKTVSTQGGANVPSVTIPVTAVSVGISVNVPTQKTIAGKNVTQQIRQIQLQQLQRNKLAQQKVANLGQLQQVGLKGPSGTTPLIIPQQHQALPKVMVQQIVKQQQPTQGATIQQFIASVPPSQTTTSTMIATQIVTQAQPTLQTVTKMSVPSGSITTAVNQPTRVSAPLTVTAVPVTPASATQAVTMSNTALVSGTPTVTLTPSPTTLVKNIHDVVISPQKTISLQSGTAQQVKTLQQASGVRQIQGTTATLAQIQGQTSTPAAIQVQQLTQAGQAVAVTSAPKILQTHPQQTTVVQQLVQPSQTITQMIPPPGVQQAVQKVLQESQAQAQHRVAVTVTTATTIVQQTSTVATVATTNPVTPGAVTTQPQALQQVVGTSAGVTPAGHLQDAQSGKVSPYTMRLRNNRSDSR